MHFAVTFYIYLQLLITFPRSGLSQCTYLPAACEEIEPWLSLMPRFTLCSSTCVMSATLLCQILQRSLMKGFSHMKTRQSLPRRKYSLAAPAVLRVFGSSEGQCWSFGQMSVVLWIEGSLSERFALLAGSVLHLKSLGLKLIESDGLTVKTQGCGTRRNPVLFSAPFKIKGTHPCS